MANKSTDKVLVVDLEATCWKYSPPEGQVHEIIEVGTATITKNSVSGEMYLTSGPEILIQPIQSEVSEFCTELTTITQDMLDESGMSFKQACDRIETIYPEASDIVWASWGDYDRWMLEKECDRKNVPFPLSGRHINVKRMTAVLTGWKKELGLLRAMAMLGLEPADDSVHHRGCDDVVNIAMVMIELMTKVRSK